MYDRIEKGRGTARNRIRRVGYEKYHGHRNLSLKQSDWVNYLRGRIISNTKFMGDTCYILNHWIVDCPGVSVEWVSLLGSKLSPWLGKLSETKVEDEVD